MANANLKKIVEDALAKAFTGEATRKIAEEVVARTLERHKRDLENEMEDLILESLNGSEKKGWLG